MLFAIYALDHAAPHIAALRLQHYPAHKLFLAAAQDNGVTIILSGPLLDDDGKTAVGSLLVVEADSKQVAQKWHETDPFFIANIWATSNIYVFDRKR